MAPHVWYFREGWETLPFCSWPNHYCCSECAAISNDGLVDAYGGTECPSLPEGTLGAIMCTNCHLRSIWLADYCPECYFPTLSEDFSPEGYYAASLIADENRVKAGLNPKK